MGAEKINKFAGDYKRAVDYKKEEVRLTEDIKRLDVMLKEKEKLRRRLETSNDKLEDMIRSGSEIILDDSTNEFVQVEGKITMSYLSELINNSSSGIFLCDKAGRIADVNNVMLKILKYKRKELIGKHALELISDRTKSAINVWNIDYVINHERLKLPQASYSSKYNENNLLDKNGNLVSVFQCSALIVDEANKPVFAVFLNKELERYSMLEKEIRDLEIYFEDHLSSYEMKELSQDLKISLQKDLRETKEYLENIFQTSCDALVILNNQGFITKINKAATQLMGHKEEELVGKHIIEICPTSGEYVSVTGEKVVADEKTVQRIWEMLEVVFNTGKLSSWCHYLKPKSSRIIPYELSVSLLKDKEGNNIGMVLSFRDLTERKMAELKLNTAYGELQEAKDYLENIISTAVDGIITVDPKGTIIRTNEAVEKMTGYTQEEMKGMHISQLGEQHNEEYRQSVRNMISRLFQDGKVTEFEATFKKKDGKLVPIEVNLALFRDKSGEIAGGVVGVRDISERKKLEKMKNEFISNVSHELRTPLTSIKGSIDNLLDGIAGGLRDTQREYLDIINNESERLVRLINDLLDLNKLEASSINLFLDEIGYIDIVGMAAYNLRGFAEEKGLNLEVKWPSEINWPEEEIQLRADKDRVNQILINLINNAIKFTERGGIEVIIEKPAHQCITTRIKDTGIGIPGDEIGKVFDKFYQVSHPHAAKSKGSGLGLAITKTLVELHGGTIWVESEEGKGSEFCFTLPVGGPE